MMRPHLFILVFGALLGSVVASEVATIWLETTPAQLASMVGAVAGLAGVYADQGLRRAIVYLVVACVLIPVTLAAAPGVSATKTYAVPAIAGFAAGSLLNALWKTVRS
jgi:hypothetical protein